VRFHDFDFSPTRREWERLIVQCCALVAVGIKADAGHQCPGNFLFGRVRHQSSLKPASNPVKLLAFSLEEAERSSKIKEKLKIFTANLRR
jgi:hypothetical protein